jgi:sugar lactone lactonase YvrE
VELKKIMKTVRWSSIQTGIGLIAFAVLLATNLQSQVKVTTVAGGFVDDGQPANKAGFLLPQFVTLDSAGNLYITDFYNHRVREVSNGTIATFAGTGVAGFGHTGGNCIKPTIARIRFPRGIVADPNSGAVYFSDSGNQRIKIVTPGCMHVFAGNGNAGYGGDNHPAGDAALNHPYGLALDSAGNLYIADSFNSAVRVVDTLGFIHTVAGNGTAGYSGDGGPATSAQLDMARGVWVDGNDNLYIADTNNLVVRMVTPWTPGPKHTIIPGTITTIAGNGSNGCSGDGGQAKAATIGPLRDVAVSNGTLYISNAGCDRVRAVNLSTGVITTYAGTSLGYDGEGNPPLSAKFSSPTGLGFDPSGNLLVVDSGNARVRQVTSTAVNTIVGGFTGDGGRGVQSTLNAPENAAFDANGNMYIAEALGNRIRKLSNTGTITTIAGTGVSGYSGDGGKATAATLNNPLGVAVDSLNNVYIADNNNSVIRVVNKTGKISTFAQNAGFGSLASLVTDPSGNVYAADQSACVVWKITPSAAVSVVAGEVSSCGYNSDGIPATSAKLNAPYGVGLDSTGNLFIGDTNNQRVRMVSTAGTISTVAGNGTCGYSGDGGNATAAQLCKPEGVGVDASGNLYIADWNNAVIRLVTGGVITTLAGSGSGAGYNGDGLPAIKANLDGPVAVAIKPKVNVPFLVDDQSYRVRVIK